MAKPGNRVPEKILKERRRNGKTEYYIKWKGVPDKYYSWELKENLNCPEVIKKFEEKCKKIKEKVEKAREEACGSGEQPRGIERNLEPKKILGMDKVKGEWQYLIQWESDEVEYVPTKIGDEKWPDMICHFAEKRLSYDSDSD